MIEHNDSGTAMAGTVPAPRAGGERGLTMLQLHLRPWIEAEIYGAAAIHMPIIRDESKKPEDVTAAFVGMFDMILKSLCSATAYQDTPLFRARARTVLPGITGWLLSKVVAEELNDESYSPVKERLTGALQMLNLKRNWSASEGASHAPSLPPCDLSARLCSVLDGCSTSTLANWFAGRILERITTTTAAKDAIGNGVDLDSLEIMLTGVRRIDRKLQYRAWSENQRRIGCPVSILRFCRAAGISRSSFYSQWFGDRWADSSLEGEHILSLLSRVWTTFPPKKTN